MTALVVDDHASFRSAMRLMLELDGYEVVGEAADGEAGLRAALELRPDVVVCDVQMPVMGGFELASALAASDGPPVILVSSHDASDYAALTVASGARGFIPKSELSPARLAALLG
jgi:DNA-binding NarL/FixJ family response regulator